MSDKPTTFTEAGVQNVVAFSEILRKIHARLLAEGYVIEKGRLIRKDGKIEGDKPITPTSYGNHRNP